MQHRAVIAPFIAVVLLSGVPLPARDFSAVAGEYRPRLESNLVHNIVAFWHPNTLDRTNGGYLLNHDINGRLKSGASKMIVTQARMVWLYSRLARAGYGQEYLEAAGLGYRFLRDKMWDQTNGGFYWQVDLTGDRKLRAGKHLYGQSFALYALSEYYLASRKPEALELATRLFNLLEAKAHDTTCGGYLESFNEDWTPVPPGEMFYMGESGLKLMNTHLHLLESMTAFYRASKLPLARERLLELIGIQSNTVVRKAIGACSDKHRRNWEPVLTGGAARVSYGHDLENIWLLMDACNAAGIANDPRLDLYRALFDYALKHGFDVDQGGFFESGDFNRPARNRDKTWWVQAEACVSALHLYRLTHDAEYLRVFRKTYDWIEQHQVDWKNGEWFETITPSGAPGGEKAHIWKAGYHNGRAMIECLEILKAKE
jgi:mannose/cellobiose epimerase-like protein (N-acyl-D-glucosamine 2-epimerase family)